MGIFALVSMAISRGITPRTMATSVAKSRGTIDAQKDATKPEEGKCHFAKCRNIINLHVDQKRYQIFLKIRTIVKKIYLKLSILYYSINNTEFIRFFILSGWLNCPSKYKYLEKHTDPQHGDVCRKVGRNYRCPKGCFKTEDTKSPFCQTSKWNTLPCRAHKNDGICICYMTL